MGETIERERGAERETDGGREARAGCCRVLQKTNHNAGSEAALLCARSAFTCVICLLASCPVLERASSNLLCVSQQPSDRAPDPAMHPQFHAPLETSSVHSVKRCDADARWQAICVQLYRAVGSARHSRLGSLLSCRMIDVCTCHTRRHPDPVVLCTCAAA